MSGEWIEIKDQMPSHMKEIKVWIDSPYYGSYERKENAVFLAFDGNIYDSEEQTVLNNVTKWKQIKDKE